MRYAGGIILSLTIIDMKQQKEWFYRIDSSTLTNLYIYIISDVPKENFWNHLCLHVPLTEPWHKLNENIKPEGENQ